MAENFDVFDFKLSDQDMTRIGAVDAGRSLFFDHQEPQMVTQLGRWRVPA